ncbi:hypothetical protein BDI4_380021 [Burkholderia diffusa]|nr:hypothetical protein BDI4_380021 [Burkholderia diffusa]
MPSHIVKAVHLHAHLLKHCMHAQSHGLLERMRRTQTARHVERQAVLRSVEVQRGTRLFIDLDPERQSRLAFDHLGRRGAMHIDAHALQQPFVTDHGKCNETVRAMCVRDADDFGHERARVLPRRFGSQRLAARHAHREAGQLPNIARTGERSVAHQIRKNITEKIGLVGRQQSTATDNFTIAIASDNVKRVRVIEIVKFDAIVRRQ